MIVSFKKGRGCASISCFVSWCPLPLCHHVFFSIPECVILHVWDFSETILAERNMETGDPTDASKHTVFKYSKFSVMVHSICYPTIRSCLALLFLLVALIQNLFTSV